MTLKSSLLPDGQRVEKQLHGAMNQSGLNGTMTMPGSGGNVTVKLKVAPSAAQDFCFHRPTIAVKHCPHSPSNRYRTFCCHRDSGDLLTHSTQWVMRQKSNFRESNHRQVSMASPPVWSEEIRFLLHWWGNASVHNAAPQPRSGFLVCRNVSGSYRTAVRHKKLFSQEFKSGAAAQHHVNLQPHSIEFLTKITSGRPEGPGGPGRNRTLIFWGSGLTDIREEEKRS